MKAGEVELLSASEVFGKAEVYVASRTKPLKIQVCLFEKHQWCRRSAANGVVHSGREQKAKQTQQSCVLWLSVLTHSSGVPYLSAANIASLQNFLGKGYSPRIHPRPQDGEVRLRWNTQLLCVLGLYIIRQVTEFHRLHRMSASDLLQMQYSGSPSASAFQERFWKTISYQKIIYWSL